MKIITDNNAQLDAEVSIGYLNEYFGLFLESRSGTKKKNPRNTQYFEALETILKRLFEAQISLIRVFVCSRNLSAWKLSDREIKIDDHDGIRLSKNADYLRKAICLAQTSIKESTSTKGGNPTKRIFITGNITEINWLSVIHNSHNLHSSVDEDFYEKDVPKTYSEGKEVLRLHRAKERNRALVVYAKSLRAKIDPMLRCQVCKFSFVEKYGEIGRDFIEAHHVLPLSRLTEETEINADDLIMVCSNCHRMLHRNGETMTVEQLKAMLKT
jgi:hypothetical protein